MQLPRGTFHSIKKYVTFRSLLDETVTSQFTGSILISFPDGVSFLVLEAGRAVLASCQNLCGKDALKRMEGMGDMRVDAELTALNGSQLALAQEFNKSCQTRLESGSSVFFGKKEAFPRQNHVPAEKTVITPVAKPSTKPRTTFGEGEVEHLLHGELDALDRMDLAKISGKFRLNAESIARELKLDHLGKD
ncbi:MAG: hypothetical protein LUO93_00495 [Methanomicrobiales archaeon]|nr:hypothetical protein [Methanomicrobiales archaeon]